MPVARVAASRSPAAGTRGVALTQLASGATPGISTPDRRVRVFVSSTLQELADERAAARAAIARLRMNR